MLLFGVKAATAKDIQKKQSYEDSHGVIWNIVVTGVVKA